MSMERIKRLSQEGIGILYGESIPPIMDEETYLLSQTSINKLIEIFEQIEKVAEDIRNGIQQNSASF